MPLFVTLAILKFGVESIDNFIKPYIVRILGQDYGFPFIGLVVTLLLIMLTGILTTNVFGQKIYRLWEKFLLKIPFFRTLYSASKQLIEGIAVPDKKTFESVVMVEYPRRGAYALGFLANRLKIHLADGEKEFWSVFIPSTPTPFSGMAILFPAGEAQILDISVEDGIKFFVSGSISAPRQIRAMERIESKPPGPATQVKS